MSFLKNIGLFVLVFFPTIALASMGLQAIVGWERVAPEWRVGWNPIIWIILTAPWHVPTILIVPILHVLTWRTRRRWSVREVRRILLVASPILALAVPLLLYGGTCFQLETWLPVVLGGLLYGALMRIPAGRGMARKEA